MHTSACMCVLCEWLDFYEHAADESPLRSPAVHVDGSKIIKICSD